MNKSKAIKKLKMEAERLGYQLNGLAMIRRSLQPVILSRKEYRKLCVELADGGYYVVRYSNKGFFIRSLEVFRGMQQRIHKAREVLWETRGAEAQQR